MLRYRNHHAAYIFATIFILAGLLHLVKPSVFMIAMPSYLPWHLEIVLLTGVIELLLAIGLILKKYRYQSGILSALYLFLILPAHFHVSINQIPMFGIDHPLVLWGRTLIQFVFIYWAYQIGIKSKKN